MMCISMLSIISSIMISCMVSIVSITITIITMCYYY